MVIGPQAVAELQQEDSSSPKLDFQEVIKLPQAVGELGFPEKVNSLLTKCSV